MSEEKASTFVTEVLVGCACVMALFAGYEWVEAKDDPVTRVMEEARAVEKQSQSVASSRRVGPDDAPVTIVTFFDYQCPYCKKLEPRLQKLQQTHSGEVQLVYRHRPIPGHDQAVDAAVASVCAEQQGAFQAYHRALFENEGAVRNAEFDRLAKRHGVDDMDRFRTCRTSSEARQQVQKDIQRAKSDSINAVPSLLIGGRLYEGAPSYDLLEQIVEEEL